LLSEGGACPSTEYPASRVLEHVGPKTT
jgi:hypothetical protein